MQIDVRRINENYVEVIMEFMNTKVTLGLLDRIEQTELAETLRCAADELDPPEEESK